MCLCFFLCRILMRIKWAGIHKAPRNCLVLEQKSNVLISWFTWNTSIPASTSVSTCCHWKGCLELCDNLYLQPGRKEKAGSAWGSILQECALWTLLSSDQQCVHCIPGLFDSRNAQVSISWFLLHFLLCRFMCIFGYP